MCWRREGRLGDRVGLAKTEWQVACVSCRRSRPLVDQMGWRRICKWRTVLMRFIQVGCWKARPCVFILFFVWFGCCFPISIVCLYGSLLLLRWNRTEFVPESLCPVTSRPLSNPPLLFLYTFSFLFTVPIQCLFSCLHALSRKTAPNSSCLPPPPPVLLNQCSL